MPPLRFQLLRTVFRYAFHVAAVLSALAFIACLILWPRSYYRQEGFCYQAPARYRAMGASAGRWSILWIDDDYGMGEGLHGFSLSTPSYDTWSYASWHTDSQMERGWFFTAYHYLGLHLTHATRVSGPPLPGMGLKIPFSYLTLLAAILPALWLRAWLRRRRAQRARGFPVELPRAAAGRAPDAEAPAPSTEPGAAPAAGDGSAAASSDSPATSGDSPAGPRASLTTTRASAPAGGASDAGRGGPSSEPPS